MLIDTVHAPEDARGDEDSRPPLLDCQSTVKPPAPRPTHQPPMSLEQLSTNKVFDGQLVKYKFKVRPVPPDDVYLKPPALISLISPSAPATVPRCLRLLPRAALRRSSDSPPRSAGSTRSSTSSSPPMLRLAPKSPSSPTSPALPARKITRESAQPSLSSCPPAPSLLIVRATYAFAARLEALRPYPTPYIPHPMSHTLPLALRAALNAC